MHIQSRKQHWMREYLICFALGFGILMLLNILRQGTPFWGVDGVTMYYTTASYAKTFWTELLHGQLTTIDFTIGEGLSPILHMAYYGLLEPWNILYVIAPESWMPIIYGAFIIMRILLSGITFGWYAQRHSHDQRAISTGAIIYVFSGYFLFWTQGPVLINAGFLLPLLVLSFEQSIEQQKHLLLVLVTAFAYLTNYYVAIMLSCILLCYGILYLSVHQLWKQVKIWIHTVLSHAIGVLISGVIVLPCILYIFNGMRSGSTGYNNWFIYPPQYYLSLIQSLFTPSIDNTLYWNHPYQSHTGFALIALPAIGMLYHSHEKTTKIMQWSLAIAAIMLCIPAFGRIFNGNTYTTNRWVVALSFIVSMIVVWAIPRMQLSKTHKKLIWGYIAISGALGFLFTSPNVAMISAVMLALTGILLTTTPLQTSLKPLMRLFVSGTVLLAMVFSQYISTFVTQNQLIQYDYYEILNKSTSITQRVGQTDNLIGANTGAIHKIFTNTSVWNVMAAEQGDYYNNIQLMPDIVHPTWASASDDRTAIQILSAGKYYITTDERQLATPVGFQYLYTSQTDNAQLHVYENLNHIGMGYIFTQTLSTDVLNQMNIAERQAALMQYAIMDDGETAYTTQSIELSHTEQREEGRVSITVHIPEGYEVYLDINNVEQRNGSWDLLPQKLVTQADENTAAIQVECNSANGTLKKQISAMQPDAHLHTLSGHRTVCLGHAMTGDVAIQFKHLDNVTIGDIKIYAIPVESLSTEKLQGNALCDVRQENNVVYGTVNAQQDGVLQIAIPYDTGWTVYIDGEEVNTFASGIKYIGVNITAGTHDIQLKYHTPEMHAGMIISCIGLSIFIVSILPYKKRKSK